MAIHNDHPGLKIEVVVDGKALPEYEGDDAIPEPNTVTRYVEAQAGIEFGVKYKFDKCFSTKRDIANKYLYLDDHPAVSTVTREIDGVPATYNLCFGSLHLGDESTDADPGQELLRHAQSIGEIKVQFKFCTLQNTWSDGVQTFNFACINSVSEKVMKANLEALHIIPRSPTPAPISPHVIPGTSTQTRKPNSEPENEHSTTTVPRQPSVSSNTTLLRQQSSAPPTSKGAAGLTRVELIGLIKHYRGNDDGLADQGTKRLQLLLEFYEDQETKSTPIKAEPVTRDDVVHIKRERDKGDPATRERKRSRPEVIVLDD